MRTPYDWQQTLYPKWDRAGRRGIVRAVPGAGKTYGAIMLLKQLPSGCVILIVVPTTTLKRQWEEELSGAGVVAEVVVVNTASGAEFKRSVDMLVVDEVHRTTSDVFSNMYGHIDYKWIIGLTATPTTEAMRYAGPVIEDVDFDEANVAEFKVIYVPVEMNGRERGLYSWYTKKMEESWGEKRKRLRFQRRRLVYSLERRYGMALALLNVHNGDKTLILTQSIDDANRLATEIGAPAYHSKRKDEKGLKAFKEDPNGRLVGVRALREGYNVPDIKVLIMYAVTLSETSYVQTLGRAIRYVEGKEATIYVLIGRGTTDEQLLQYHTMHQSIFLDGLEPPVVEVEAEPEPEEEEEDMTDDEINAFLMTFVDRR